MLPQRINTGAEAPQRRTKPAILQLLGAIVIALYCGVPSVQAQPRSPLSENDIKAAYLFKLTKFIEWPDDAFESANSDIKVCITGNNPFSPAFYNLSGKVIGKRPLNIVHVQHRVELSQCHIVYLAMEDQQSTQSALETLDHHPILTVSDTPDFVGKNGMVGFVTRPPHVLIEINLRSALAANIGIRAQLLEVAQKVIRYEGGS